MNIIFKILFACSILCIACNSTEDPIVAELEIRVRNVSSFDYTDIFLSTSEDHDYGDLTSGAESSYQGHEKAFRYCFVQLFIEQDSFIIQPIDFVGETELEPGKYTYEIDALDSQDLYGRLSMTLVKD